MTIKLKRYEYTYRGYYEQHGFDAYEPNKDGDVCLTEDVTELEAIASEMYAVLDDIIGEAAFEGLPESKQDAIHVVMAKLTGETL